MLVSAGQHAINAHDCPEQPVGIKLPTTPRELGLSIGGQNLQRNRPRAWANSISLTDGGTLGYRQPTPTPAARRFPGGN